MHNLPYGLPLTVHPQIQRDKRIHVSRNTAVLPSSMPLLLKLCPQTEGRPHLLCLLWVLAVLYTQVCPEIFSWRSIHYSVPRWLSTCVLIWVPWQWGVNDCFLWISHPLCHLGVILQYPQAGGTALLYSHASQHETWYLADIKSPFILFIVFNFMSLLPKIRKR